MSTAAKYFTQIYGPKSAVEPTGSAVDVAPATRQQLVHLFRERLAAPQSVLQMLVETREFDPFVVNLQRFGAAPGAAAAAAVAHFLRANLAGDRPALAAVCVMLSGEDAGADEEAVRVVEASADADGRKLPLSPTAYEKLREAPRPLMALLCFTDQSVKDPGLRVAAACLADAFYKSLPSSIPHPHSN